MSMIKARNVHYDYIQYEDEESEPLITHAVKGVDLDIENPYFRSREQGENLEKAGVKVYSDAYGGKSATELQTLDPAIRTPLEDEGCRVICDLGGDPEGKLRMLMTYAGEERDVSDPWYSRRFDVAFDDIYEGCEGLLRALKD